MNAFVLVCGNVFDGISDALTGPAEILVEDNRIAKIERSVGRPPGARVIDLSQRTVSPGFIDTHVHLTMDAANLALQTLESSAAKALKGLSLAREYMNYGFTTLRDLGSVDPEWPTIDLRNALNTGLLEGPRLFVAAHIVSASAGHGDLRGSYASRWTLPVSAIADDLGSIRALVRREHTVGSDWVKTTNTGGYFLAGSSVLDLFCLRPFGSHSQGPGEFEQATAQGRIVDPVIGADQFDRLPPAQRVGVEGFGSGFGKACGDRRRSHRIHVVEEK